MNVPGLSALGRPRLVGVGVLLLAAVILVIPAGRRPFWSSDEARYALLAQDILEHGRWLVPELRGEPYLNKPQLYFWSVALVSMPVGSVTELTAAIPSVVFALVGVAGVMAIGRLLWGWRAGMLAGLVLTTTPGFFEIGHQVHADVMLNAGLIWALYFLLRARREGWSLAWLVAFYLCVGTALVSKGPEGLVGLGAAAMTAWLMGGWTGLWGLRPAWGLAVLILMMLPWVVPYLLQSGGHFVNDVLLGHYATWYFRGSSTARLRGMLTAVVNFFPWTVFLAGAVFWWRRAPDDGRRWVGFWTLTLWLLLGLSGTQRTRYLLPVYPGLALLTAEFLGEAWARGGRRALRVTFLVFCVLSLAAVVLIVSPLTDRIGPEDRVFVPDVPWERVLVVSLIVAAVVAAGLAVRYDAFPAGTLAVALAVGILMMLLGVTYPARYAHAFDVRALAKAAAAHTPADGTVVGHPDLRLSYDFYLRRRVIEMGSPGAVARMVAAPSRDVLITTRARWMELAPLAARSWRVLAARSVGNREMVVVGSRSR